MALIQREFKSETLKRTVPVNVILPIEKFKGPYPTLYLLHGLTDNCNGWLSYSRIRLWAEDSGLAVVMPSGENSFYIIPRWIVISNFQEFRIHDMNNPHPHLDQPVPRHRDQRPRRHGRLWH